MIYFETSGEFDVLGRLLLVITTDIEQPTIPDLERVHSTDQIRAPLLNSSSS